MNPQKIRVELGERSYNIYIGSGILDGIGNRLRLFNFSRKIAIVSNPTVFNMYGETVSASIRDAGFDLHTVLIPDGEAYKTIESVQQIYDALLRHQLDRSSALIALGGGVIGDIAGFAASTYMRGIAYAQVPTTLLSQVDSSVGGKTGVNHPLGKNMIGTFWQPCIVWIDTDTLGTLPLRELRAGLAEVIKYGIIRDTELFTYLDRQRESILNLESTALSHIIKRSCEIKAEVVSMDERESGLRAILNYGHTIGHALEAVTHFTTFLHGEAVAIGMCLEAKLSQHLGLTSAENVKRIRTLIEAYGLPTSIPHDIDPRDLFSSMCLDKKAIAGKLTFILPEEIGRVVIRKNLDEQKLRELFGD